MQPRNRDKARTIDPLDPSREEKWGYTNEEIYRIMPGLQPIPGEERYPKYPQVQVRLIGEDGNAFNLVGRVILALRQAGISDEERRAFLQEATAGTYDVLLQTIMRWVEVR